MLFMKKCYSFWCQLISFVIYFKTNTLGTKIKFKVTSLYKKKSEGGMCSKKTATVERFYTQNIFQVQGVWD